MLKVIAGVLAALALIGASIVLAAGTKATPAPKLMTLACAKNDSGKLQYVSTAADCPKSRGRLIHFPQDRPVKVCELDKANPATMRKAALPPPAHRHNVKGMLFKVDFLTQCHGPRYPDSHGVILPKAYAMKLCAGNRHGTVREVAAYTACNNLEFRAVLAKRPNNPPKANDQKVDVNENTAKSITLTGSDPDGDTLTFTLTSSPSHGTLSGTPPNLTYTPAFNYSGPDSFKFKVSDGHGHSSTGNVTITVHHTSDSPVINASAGSTAYTENDPGVVIDSGLTVTDADDANLEGATVKVSGNFQAGDELVFVDQLGITGTYNSGTGVLTLTGTAAVSDYQAALRSVKFQSSNDDPATARTIEFAANDGSSTGPPASKQVTVTPVNDAPTLTTTGSNLAYTEGDGQKAIDPGLTAADPDSATLAAATVQISANFVSADDELSFTDTPNITGSYNDSTGVLTLTGTDTVANYEAALRTVKYENVSDNPSGSKTLSFQADDGAAANNLSNVATRTIDLTAANDAPVVTTSSGSTAYTEGDPATTIDSGLTVSDPDDTNIESAQVRVSSGFESGDDLVYVDQNGISGVYNTGTGVLTLTGTASLSDYQTALRSIQYRHTGDNPAGSKTVGYVVNDGALNSSEAFKGIDITGVNDGPTINTTATNLAYTEGDGAVAADSGLTVSDPDSANLSGATVQITGNFVSADDELAFTNTANITGVYNDSTGTLTLSGTDTVANYQAALRSVTYENVNDNPSGSKTVSFQATDDAAAASNVATRTIDLTGANDAPVVTTSAGDTAYTEGDPATTIDGSLTVTDADDTNIESGQVRISSGFQSGDDLVFVNQNGISGVYNTGTGVLTLTGTASVADYQTALRSIQYRHTGDNPSSSKTVEFKVNDGDVDSNAATKGLSITGVNDGPTITTTVTNLSYTEGDGAVAADNGLTVSDPDSTNLSSATVKISSNFVSADDELAFTDTATITGSYNDSTGVLTLSGTDTVANYQAALRSVTYENVNQNPSGSKTISFDATDDGAAASNTATRTVDLTGVNTAPTVTTSSGSTAYTEGDPATTIDGSLTVSDPDDTNIESGQVRISSGFQSGDDLVFVNTANISGVYNTGTGVLTLTGTDTVANYESALRSIKYQTTNNSPSSPKTVEFKVNDGALDSNAATKDISITGVNTAPTVNTTATNLAYTEGDGAVAADNGFTVSDPDSTNLSGATVQITGNFVSADDELAFTNTANITGAYNDSTGTLTLSGTDTVANYQAAVRSVTYENSSDNPSGSKTVSFQATDDAAAASNVATRTIDLTGVNDAPVVTPSNGSTAYTEGDPATTIDGSLTVTDADDTNIESGQVRISSGFQSGDDLVFVNQNGISGVYNTGTGVLTLTGTASVADYQTALRSIQFQSTNNNPVTSKTVEFKVNDGDVDSNAPTKEIAVTPVNSPPTVTAGGTLSYTENDPATAVAPALTVTEPEGDLLQGGSASITTGFQSGEDALSWTDNNLLDTIILDVANTTSQTVALKGVGTDAEYQAALRAVKYQNSSESPSNTARTVTFSATDASSATGSDTRGISVTPVDDPPVAVDDSATMLEDPGATAVNVLANDTDVDAGLKEITAIGSASHGTVTGTGGSANHWTGLTYEPAANYCNDPPGTTPDTFTYTLNGGSTATVSVTVTCVNDAPVADDETFTATQSAIGNTTFVGNDPDDGAPATPDPTDTSPVTDRPQKTITADILAGDTDVDGPGPLTVTPGTFSTNDGGSVTIQSDGDFVFEPKASTSCTDHQDFFDYTVNDNGSPNQTDTGRVTIDITGCVWYVNNDDSGGNSGTSEKPFDTLAQAQTASGTGDSIFVYDGNDTTTGYDAGIDLKANQKLIGEAATLTVGSDTLHTADAANRPTLTDSASDVVAVDDGNEVKGLELDPSGGASGGGIAAGTGDVAGTIDDVKVIDDDGTGAQQAGLEIDNATGTWNISNLIVQTTSGASGIRVNNSLATPATVNFTSTGTISSESTGGKALDVTGTVANPVNMGSNSQFDVLRSTTSNAGGVGIVNATGTTHLGDGSGTDLDLTTTSGASAGLLLINAGTVDVPSAGTSDIHADGGPALDVQSTSGVALPLDTVESQNSSTDGINFDGNGTGTFSAVSGGTNGIKGASGIGVDVNGGSGNFNYPGKLDDGSGATADITGRTGGTVTLSGAISDGVDGGGGITLSGNSGGSTDFTNASKVLNTGASDAITMGTSDGHTLNLTNGGLDITTAAGKGLEATTSGTINVSGSGNKISTGSGRALNLTDTDVGASGATFEKISAGTGSGTAGSGIQLSNTGTTSGLTVTGNGGTCTSADQTGCTGGTIQHKTGSDDSTTTPSGTGIVLNNTKSPSLTRVFLHDFDNYAVRGTAVSGFTFANSVINGTNGSNGASPFNDSSMYFNNGSGAALTGSASISNSHIGGGHYNQLWVSQTAGSLNRLTVDTVSFGGNSTTEGNDTISLEGQGTSTMNATVKNSTFTSAKGDQFDYIANGSGNSDLDFDSNTMTDSHPAINGGGIIVRGGAGSGNVTVNIHGTNTLNDAHTVAALVQKSDGAGDMTGTIDNLTIGTSGTANSGSLNGSGLRLLNQGGGDMTMSLTGSHIYQYNNFGLELQAGDGLVRGGNFRLNVTGNTVSNPGNNHGAAVFQGVLLNSGVTAGDSFATCLHLKSNSVVGAGTNGGTDIRARARQATTVNLPGYGGTTTDTAAAATFLANQNDNNANDPAANAPVPTSSAAKDASSGGFTGTGTDCS